MKSEKSPEAEAISGYQPEISPMLYLRTIFYLKPLQLFYNIYYRLKKPKSFSIQTPELSGLSAKIPFPKMPQTFFGNFDFCFLNDRRKLAFPADWNNGKIGKLWLYNLHYFDYLRQENISPSDGEMLISQWINDNPAPVGNGWEPYPISLRIANWIKYALCGNKLPPATLNSLALQAEFLCRRTEKHLLANHYLANAKALVFAGMFFKGKTAEKWLKKGLAIYKKELPEQILPDGGHFERSAMYHSIILEDLLDLYNISANIELREIIENMLKWLSKMTSPDGGIVFLNDAANGIALSPEKIFAYAKALSLEVPTDSTASADLPQTGYARLCAGKWTLICDGAPIGPSYQPGHAHADTLSFEMWYGDKKIFTNAGTYEYIDTPIRKYQRSTAAHNAVMIDGKNSSEVWKAHRVAQRANIVRREFSENAFYAEHDGYKPRIHGRKWEVSESKVKIEETIVGNGECRIDVFYHLASGAKIDSVENGLIKISVGDSAFEMRYSPQYKLAVSAGKFSPEFGKLLDSQTLIFSKISKLPSKFASEISIKTDNENTFSKPLL